MKVVIVLNDHHGIVECTVDGSSMPEIVDKMIEKSGLLMNDTAWVERQSILMIIPEGQSITLTNGRSPNLDDFETGTELVN